MDNLKDLANRIDTEASTSSNEPFSSSKKRKLSDDQYQNEFESMKQKLDKQKDIIYNQICELHEERSLLKSVKDELERMKNVESELQTKIVTFEVQKKMSEAKLRSDMNDQLARFKKQNDEKDKKIKELEAQLQSKVIAGTSLLAEITQMQQNNNDQTKILQDEINRLNAVIKEQDQKSKETETERKLAAEVSTVAQLEFELEEMKKCYKADLKKNEEDKKVLKNEHDKKMADMKAEMQEKIDFVTKEHATAINQLNATNEDLLKKISENQEALIQYQRQIKELNDKITVAKTFNIELHSQNEELKQTELDARAEIIDREKQIRDLQNELGESDEDSEQESTERIVDLDELCDESGFRYDRLLGQKKITLIKIGKFEYIDRGLTICSETGDQNVELNLLNFMRNVCQFQINGECNLQDSSNWNDMVNIMPIIHSFNLIKLNFGNVILQYHDFMKLVSSHTITKFIGGSVKRENGEYLGIDEILKELPNIEICLILSKNDCKKLAELPTFSNLRKFELRFTKSPDNLLIFADFIKKHQNAKFYFDASFCNALGCRNFPKKLQNLLEILPSNCQVFKI